MTNLDRWGPFEIDLDACERRARLRSLRAITRLMMGRDGDLIERMLRCAETGHVSLEAVNTAINKLPSIPFRKILATYAALTGPAAPCT